MKNVFKIGQTVTYSHYGVSQSAKITRMSESGEVLFLDNGGWKHAISCDPEKPASVNPDIGYLQHGEGLGPFSTESVNLKHPAPDTWHAFFEGKWRKVHVQISRLFIVYRGEKIPIQIEGV